MKDINLLPRQYILEKQNKAKRYKITMALIIGCVLLSFSIAYPLLVKYALTLKSETILTQIKASNNYVEAEKQFTLIKDLYNQRVKAGENLRQKGINLLLIMDKLEKAMPENLFIVSMMSSQTDNSTIDITLEGMSSSQDAIATFIKNLRQDEYFANIVLSSIIKSGNESMDENIDSSSNVQHAFNMKIFIGGEE